MSEVIFISTAGCQATSSDHSHMRLCSESPFPAGAMFTTSSRSGNSQRWAVSASRSFGPMSGSADISSKQRSMTSRNSSADLKLPIPSVTLGERGSPLHQVLVELLLDGVADALGYLEDERAVVGGVRA